MSSLEYAITQASKLIELDRKVNQYLVKGSIIEKTIANFKRYQVIKIHGIKMNMRNEKCYEPDELVHHLSSNDPLKLVRKNPDANEIPNEVNNINIQIPQPAHGNAVQSSKALLPPSDVYEINREDSEHSIRSHQQIYREKEKKVEMNMKNIIHIMFKNIKNIFTKEESNVPKDMLLRTILIKKLILYLIVLLIMMSTFYLVFISIYVQYNEYKSKLQSSLMITKYHNITTGVINEYIHRDIIQYRSNTSIDSYNSTKKVIDTLNNNRRIERFRLDLLDKDSDTNIRSDFFFTPIGSHISRFVLRYLYTDDIHMSDASTYTIFMILIEKIITIDNSYEDTIEARVFIDDNFINIINPYFIDSFKSSMDECTRLLRVMKVRTY